MQTINLGSVTPEELRTILGSSLVVYMVVTQKGGSVIIKK